MPQTVLDGDGSWAAPPDTTTDSAAAADTSTDSDTVTTTDTSFHDGVRTTFPQDDNITSEKRYEDPDGDGQADDVDVRGLFRKPTVDLLRYHARENPYGRPIVRKPVEDAFKHGFQTESGGDDDAQTVEEFLHDHLATLKRAIVYARMDGLVVVMHQVADAAQSVSEQLDTRTASFEGLKLWTLDHLTDDISEAEAADHTDYEHDQLNVTDGAEHGGVIFVDDISSPDHGTVVGYGVEPRDESEDVQSATFVHASRCHHLTWDDHVQGPLGNEISGHHVGESILTPILQPLEAAQMGFWATKNILFRYSAPLHAVEPPESWNAEEFDEFTEKLEDLSMASDATLPPGAELSVAEGVSEFDPEPFYDTLVSAMCAGTEFTRSVLQGTQTGTVSGSETDIKGYFSDVHVFRTGYVADFFHEVTEQVGRYDQSTIPRAAAFDWQMDWGPLFKPNDLEQAEGAVSLITAATNGIKNYVLTPDEARSLLSEEWATFDIDVSLDDLTEDEMDTFDRINVREVGRGPKDDEPVEGGPRQNPRLQNGGGQPAGQTREQSQPATDQLTEELATFLDANYTSGEIVATPDGVGVVSGTLTEKIEDMPGTDETIDATDRELLVVGFGGAFGIYPDEALDAVDSVTADAETDGKTIHYHDGGVDIEDVDLPEGWDTNSLLSWWAGIGGEWSEAKDALADEDDISEQQAEELAANYKHAVLGTTEQIER